MIDNFDKFPFERVDGEFYFFQLIKRKKDNPDTPGINGNNSARCIKEYSIHTKEELDKRRQEMIDIAIATNSHVYMHPSRRSKDEIKKLMCLMMGEHICHNKHNLSGLYRSACGESKGTERLRVIDIDGGHTVETEARMAGIGFTIAHCKPYNKEQRRLATKNGYHIICKPFDLQKFKEIHPDIDVHKNNPTVIFIP